MVSVLDLPAAIEYLHALERRLPGKTLRHVKSVAEFMSSFSDDLNIAPQQVAAAGLLHDYCKPVKPHDLLEQAQRLGVDIREIYESAPGLLHGPVAAEICRREFGIDDEVYEAIAWHTTGVPGLGRVGLALYVADYAEPYRDRPEADHARGLVVQGNFLEALRYVANHKLDYVRSKAHMDPISEDFARWVHSRECEEMLR